MSYELSILEPTVLTGVLEKYVAPPENVARPLFRKQSHPFSVAKWDVLKGSRQRAQVTMPNREGKIVEQLGVGEKTASFIYVREKKAFEPTTLRWLREPGQLAKANAEACIRRETKDLNDRLERLVESFAWDALKGTITISEPDVKATVDMGIDATHKPTAATLWSDTLNADIIGNVKAWKKLVQQDSGFNPTEIYLSSDVMDYVYNNSDIRELFTDRHKNQYLQSMTLEGLLGFNWHVFDGGYENTSDVFVPYIPSTHIIMMAKGGNPFILYEGLSADEEAPRNHTGKFAKTWKTKDPSATFVLIEYNFLPLLQRPDNIVYAQIAS
jgi:hypothetical protein